MVHFVKRDVVFAVAGHVRTSQRQRANRQCLAVLDRKARTKKRMRGDDSLRRLDDARVAVHVVCRENVFWETLESLKAAGATSVLVMPVEKMLA